MVARLVSGVVVIWAAFAGSASGQPAQSGAQGAAARSETIVVTASRTERSLAEAPAAVTVIESAQIVNSAADDYGDLLRSVPGVNVAQTSARDINVTARGATSTLANSQLALLDGRSLYLDFFGFVMWDLVPVQPREVDRIEVVRGPGSAVWGANAMSGVVNVITKSPRDLLGTTVVVGTEGASVLHAGAGERLAYKLSGGYFEQSSYPRPTGEIPGSSPPQTYPDFANEDTDQRRLDVAFDLDLGDSGDLVVGAGYADTTGILHSGIGPFDVLDGSNLSSYHAAWRNGAWRVSLAASFLDGDAINLLTRRADGQPLSFDFLTDTYDLDVSNTSFVGTRHTLTYGASFRANDFTLEIAPGASSRNQWSLFLQDEIELTQRLRWLIGTRTYEDDALDSAEAAPRTSLVFAATEDHAFRVSYNEAFRTPSAINEYLDVTILQSAGPLLIPATAVGNLALEEEAMQAYEIGYVGTLGRDLTLTVDLYRNVITDSIDFYVVDSYGPANLPTPSAGLPAQVVPCFLFAPGTGPGACPFGGLSGLVPSDYSYRNVGQIVNRGVELGLSGGDTYRWYANASWQDEPEIGGGIDAVEINVPPEWRVNLGLARDVGRYFWDASVNYQGEAYWADVLFARAPTDSFVQLNVAAGWRFLDDERLTAKVGVQNLTDEDVQQHIFGDIIERRVEAQLVYELGGR